MVVASRTGRSFEHCSVLPLRQRAAWGGGGNREEDGGSETVASNACLCEALPLTHSTNTPGAY